MAKLLRDEGYTVVSPESAHEAPACALPPAGWRCTRAAGHEGPCAALPVSVAPWTADDLHQALDLLFAQYQLDNRELRSGLSVLDLLKWSHERLKKRAKAKG